MGKGGARERADQHIAREVRGAREGARGEGAPDARDTRARASLARLWAARSTLGHGHEGLVGALTPCADRLAGYHPHGMAMIPRPSCTIFCFLFSPYIYGVISILPIYYRASICILCSHLLRRFGHLLIVNY